MTESKEATTTPWWQTAAWVTLAVVVLGVAASYAPYPFNLIAVGIAAVYLVVFFLNPATWLRRMAGACVTAATASGALPDLSARFDFSNGFIEFSKTGTLAWALLFAGVAFAGLEVWQNRPGRPLRDTPKDRLEADIKAYFTNAITKYKEISLAGFKTKVRVQIRLEDLHVPLRAMLNRNPRSLAPALNANEAHERMGEHGSEIMLSEAFQQAKKLEDMRGLVILGDPGSGKTTHLLRLLLKIANDGAASLGLAPGTVPVFLPLRRLIHLDQGLDAFIEQELANPHYEAPKQFGARLRDRGRVLYLLDGLDEVRDPRDRAKVAGWIEDARRHCPDSWFVVTCRYAGYRAAPLSGGFLELHLKPLTDPQVEDFVQRWFSIVECQLVDPTKREHARADARAKADALLADLRRPDLRASTRVAELTRNPLLLTTICMVHYDRGKLPDRRSELYAECVDVLLERWNEAKSLPQRIPANEAKQVLQPLALWMHEGLHTVAPEHLLRPEVERGLAAARLAIDATAFLHSIRDESGLLTGWGQEQYGFMHLGFQEYLAARALRNREFLQAGAFEQLAGRFGDSWWQEVILLLLAEQDPPVFDKFMPMLLARDEFVTWAEGPTMGLVLSESSGVSEQPFVRLLEQPGASDDPSLASRQVAAARVLAWALPHAFEALTVRLAKHEIADQLFAQHRSGAVIVDEKTGIEWVRIPGGTFLMGTAASDEEGYDDERPQHEVTLAGFSMARTPVTNAQYQRYLAATPNARQPASWGDRNYNQPQQPVVGVSWDEAQAYCEWAGLVLPTEAQWEYAARAGTTTRYHSGDSEADLARVGWYAGNSDGRLHAVAELPANDFGLHDVHGNVWEWTREAWASNYEIKPRPGGGLRHEPVGGVHRVIRGGGFDYDARFARSAYRYSAPPGDRGHVLGFRPARIP